MSLFCCWETGESVAKAWALFLFFPPRNAISVCDELSVVMGMMPQNCPVFSAKLLFLLYYREVLCLLLGSLIHVGFAFI